MQNRLRELKRALVVAVSKYNDPLKPLLFCENDGCEMYELLKSPGYQIPDNNKLLGLVEGDQIRNAIYDFFTDENIKSQDTLLFYYSGHGVPDVDGDVYLASSEINPKQPYRKGFSFGELTKMMNKSASTKIVTILDCCYSGAAEVSKGNEDDAATIGTAVIEHKSQLLKQGEGKCILAASQATQEAYGKKKGNHSIFTYYLLEGLRENKNSIDIYGNVTADTLGTYVYDVIMNLPIDKRPSQKPIRKMEAGGSIVLAYYPGLAPVVPEIPEDVQILKLLQDGQIVEFNRKHQQNGANARLSLRAANLVGLNLSGANLTGADLCNAALNNADLSRADLSNTDLTNAHLNEANLIGATLVKANLFRINLYHANLTDADLTNAHLNEANLIGATLVKANLIEADLSNSNLVGANLSYANFDKANLSHAKLMFADIAHAENFEKANLKGSDLMQTKNLPISKREARSKGASVSLF